MNREVHVRFCEGLGVKFPRATRPPGKDGGYPTILPTDPDVSD